MKFTDDMNIQTLEQLHALIEVALREHGNMPLNISVFQETPDNPHGAYFEDRDISSGSGVVTKEDGQKMFELCI